MNHYKNEILNEQTFTKDDINKILEENSLNCRIININYFLYKKVFIKVEENKKNYLLKLSLDDYSIGLSKNEANGYSNFNKFYKSKFNLISYEMINQNENYALSKMQFINGTKGRYLELNKFCNTNFHDDFKSIHLKDYVNLIRDRYNINQNENKINELFNNKINTFISKYETYNIPLEVSHGDLVHYNTIKTSDKYYVFDLEFYQKQRPYLYDSFTWYIIPFIYKSNKFEMFFDLIKKLNPFFLKMLNLKLKNNLNKKILENKELFEILLICFLLERYLNLSNIINLKNIDTLIDNNSKVFLEKNINLILALLIKFTKEKK